MSEQQPHWHPIEPTIPVFNPLVNPYTMEPIPPPPYKRRKTIPLVAMLLLTLLVFLALSGGIVYYYALHPTVQAAIPTRVAKPIVRPTSVPTLIPTVNPNYTAIDLVNDYHAAGVKLLHPQYNVTIWSWTADTYSVSVYETSSVTFSDDSGCTGYCSPLAIGLWIYKSNTDAQQAYYEVGNDESTQGSIPVMGTPSEYVHGRCLLLGPSPNSVYVQIMMQNCV